MSLLTLYESASPELRNAGRTWYPDANRFAKCLSIAYRLPMQTTAAVISALSPQTRWNQNTAGADKLLLAVSKGLEPPSNASLYLKNVEKATRIARRQLPPSDAFRGYTKTWAFHRNILLDPGAVTLDTWMLRALNLDRTKGLTQKNYRYWSDVVMQAARDVGEVPYNFQAIVWLAIKDQPLPF